ncbi:glycosyltransferase [Clostridium sp.]|uniref:glycosyltransferase n=1 Tax=Clostridium sp. TaxID=1506 RepID=UPI003D6D85B0
MGEPAILSNSPLANLFYSFGLNSIIQEDFKISNVSYISIGTSTFIKDNSWFNICSYENSIMPKIIIGDGCQIGSRFTISIANKGIIEKNVIIAPSVYISDCSHNYENIGIPIMNQGITSITNEIVIGENSWIGVNASIVGNVHIGRGCVVGANSYVTKNIPDYSVVAGSPAKVIKMYDTITGQWIRTRNDDEINKVLEGRKNNPLISICIPTFNRATQLEKCLNSIYSQIGNDSLFEVFVSNNNSTDNSEDVINKFFKLYDNLTYNKNEINTGPDKNIALTIEKSKGRYFILHGDDDYFKENTIYPLMDVINKNVESSLLFINVLSNKNDVIKYNGINEFLQATSISSSFISSVIIKRETFNKIDDPFKFIDTKFNQIYLQYMILLNNPTFTLINRSIFYYEGTNPSGYNFGKIFIKNYLDILYYFAAYGLNEEIINRDKLQILQTTLLPWYKRIMKNKIDIDMDNFEGYFMEYYKDEPYFEDTLKTFNDIKDAATML